MSNPGNPTTDSVRKCPCCGCWVAASDIQRRRMNTMYYDEEMNWTTSCTPCFEEIEAYWAERWRDYYAGLR